MATSNDIKNGTVIKEAGQLWSVVEFQHVKPGKGGAFVRTKQKNVVSGKIIDKTFNSDTKVDTATVDRREMQYLYMDGDDYVFMDNTTFDQFMISEDIVGDAKDFMLENQSGQASFKATRRRGSEHQIEEVGQRHLEGLGHFAGVRPQHDGRRDTGHHRRDPVAGTGAVVGQEAEHLHPVEG